jgi:acyl carrier protein
MSTRVHTNDAPKLGIDEIRARVIQAIAASTREPLPPDVGGATCFVEDLGFSSLQLLDLVTLQCVDFEIEPFEEEQLLSLATVDDLCHLIDEARR